MKNWPVGPLVEFGGMVALPLAFPFVKSFFGTPEAPTAILPAHHSNGQEVCQNRVNGVEGIVVQFGRVRLFFMALASSLKSSTTPRSPLAPGHGASGGGASGGGSRCCVALGVAWLSVLRGWGRVRPADEPQVVRFSTLPAPEQVDSPP